MIGLSADVRKVGCVTNEAVAQDPQRSRWLGNIEAHEAADALLLPPSTHLQVQPTEDSVKTRIGNEDSSMARPKGKNSTDSSKIVAIGMEANSRPTGLQHRYQAVKPSFLKAGAWWRLRLVLACSGNETSCLRTVDAAKCCGNRLPQCLNAGLPRRTRQCTNRRWQRTGGTLQPQKNSQHVASEPLPAIRSGPDMVRIECLIQSNTHVSILRANRAKHTCFHCLEAPEFVGFVMPCDDSNRQL